MRNESRDLPAVSAQGRREFLQRLAAGVAFAALGGEAALGQSLLARPAAPKGSAPYATKTKSYTVSTPAESGTYLYRSFSGTGSATADPQALLTGTYTTVVSKDDPPSQTYTETYTYDGPQTVTVTNAVTYCATPPVTVIATYSTDGASYSATITHEATPCTYETTLTQTVTYTTTTWWPPWGDPEPRSAIIPGEDADETEPAGKLLGSLDAIPDIRDVRTRKALPFRLGL